MAISKNKTRVSCSIDKDLNSEIVKLAKDREMSKSEWITWAIEQAVAAQRGQYGLAGLEAQRLNQVQNSIVEMAGSVDNLADLIQGLVKMMNTLHLKLLT